MSAMTRHAGSGLGSMASPISSREWARIAAEPTARRNLGRRSHGTQRAEDRPHLNIRGRGRRVSFPPREAHPPRGLEPRIEIERLNTICAGGNVQISADGSRSVILLVRSPDSRCGLIVGLRCGGAFPKTLRRHGEVHLVL